MVDYEAIAKKYKVDVSRIKLLMQKIEELCPGESSDFYETTFAVECELRFGGGMLSPIEYAKSQNVPENKVVILGISRTKNDNAAKGRIAKNEYDKNPHTAVLEGLVEERTGQDGSIYPVALDTRKFLDEKKTKVNENFGKPLPYSAIREFIMLRDGKIVLGRGDLSIWHKVVNEDLPEDDPKRVSYKQPSAIARCGVKAIVYGNHKATASDKLDKLPYTGTVRIWRDAYDDIEFGDAGVFPNLWKATDKILGESKYFCDINDVPELPNYGYFVTHGYVTETEIDEGGENKSTSAVVYITDKAAGRRVKAKTNYVSIVNDVKSNLREGDEVYLVCERASFYSNDDKDWKPYNVLMGVIKNPESKKVSDAVSKMREIDI